MSCPAQSSLCQFSSFFLPSVLYGIGCLSILPVFAFVYLKNHCKGLSFFLFVGCFVCVCVGVASMLSLLHLSVKGSDGIFGLKTAILVSKQDVVVMCVDSHYSVWEKNVLPLICKKCCQGCLLYESWLIWWVAGLSVWIVSSAVCPNFVVLLHFLGLLRLQFLLCCYVILKHCVLLCTLMLYLLTCLFCMYLFLWKRGYVEIRSNLNGITM